MGNTHRMLCAKQRVPRSLWFYRSSGAVRLAKLSTTHNDKDSSRDQEDDGREKYLPLHQNFKGTTEHRWSIKVSLILISTSLSVEDVTTSVHHGTFDLAEEASRDRHATRRPPEIKSLGEVSREAVFHLDNQWVKHVWRNCSCYWKNWVSRRSAESIWVQDRFITNWKIL